MRTSKTIARGYYKINAAVEVSTGERQLKLVSIPALGKGLLAIHKPVFGVSPCSGEFVITHLPSGLHVSTFASRKKAMAALEELLPLADWATVHCTGFTLSQRERLPRICRAR